MPRIVWPLPLICCLVTAANGTTYPPGFFETLVVEGLTAPTAMAFSPDGRLFVCEQGGSLRVIKGGALLPAPFLTVSVNAIGERGLLGIAFDPSFAANHRIYVYYTTPDAPIHNRVSRFTANGDVAQAGSEAAILDLDNLSAAPSHNAGAIHFGPDGKLYVAVGENGEGSNAQSFGNRLGKILRINPDGSIPTDNPFVAQTTGPNQSIWAMGLRNPFTFNFSARTGRMHINDVGQISWEEVNEGIAGSNYGWPFFEGRAGSPSFRDALIDYNHNTGSPTGCAITGGAFLTPSNYPAQYTGAYFYADFCSQWIYYLTPPAYNIQTPFATSLGRSAVDLEVWNGELYYLSRDGDGAVWSVQYTAPAAPLQFVPVTPCRLVDTRENLGAFGRPALAGGVPRDFAIPQHASCGIPFTARAYALNITVVPTGRLGYVTVWPTGTAQPFVSTLNSVDGRIKANAAIVQAGANGAVSVYATNATELVVDINGYFADAADEPQSLAFYPISPCRIADTRLGGPVIAQGQTRDFPVLASQCGGIPVTARAYSLNATVVPPGPLGYLTLWPTGQPQPLVSTLNALSGAVAANAAIIPAGVNGSVSAFVSNQSHLVLDISGYFAPPGAANAQRFYATAPCRLLDTRGATGEFGGPVLAAGQVRSYDLLLANCGLPGNAAAYSLNATVVPTTALGYLTLWPAGAAQPFVSTLNATDDPVVANAAIVPAGTAGGVTSFVTGQTHLILDLNGYFAQ